MASAADLLRAMGADVPAALEAYLPPAQTCWEDPKSRTPRRWTNTPMV